MTHKPIVLIGVGEMGGVFARGFLHLGYPIYPVTRHMNMSITQEQLPDPEMVLIAVGENDLQSVLAEIPESWKSRLCLLQNELLPNDWVGIDYPTVISVWFEKKPGIEAKVIIPSPVYGPQAEMISSILKAMDIPTRVLHTSNQLLFELVIKNLYILTSNIAGLRTGGSVGELWNQHQTFAKDIAREVIQIQEALTGTSLDAEPLIQGMLDAFNGDPEHKCMGRSAPARLNRALSHADRFGISAPTMRELQAELPKT